VLAGRTRLSLLRRILVETGQSVSQFADAEGISISRASQELRRLQSRGIIGVRRIGRRVEYVPEADPLVNTSEPLLAAMKKTCRRLPPSEDERICRLAAGLGHEKRIEILRQLRSGPLAVNVLRDRMGCSEALLFHHLHILCRDGWVRHRNRMWQMKANRDIPLAVCLLKLI
jgi:predicted transcriptional regulator